MIGCDPSSITVVLRKSTDTPTGPSTSVLAKPLADFTGIPLPADGLSEFAEAASMLSKLRQLNPDKAKHHIDSLRDALVSEQVKVRQSVAGDTERTVRMDHPHEGEVPNRPRNRPRSK